MKLGRREKGELQEEKLERRFYAASLLFPKKAAFVLLLYFIFGLSSYYSWFVEIISNKESKKIKRRWGEEVATTASSQKGKREENMQILFTGEMPAGLFCQFSCIDISLFFLLMEPSI